MLFKTNCNYTTNTKSTKKTKKYEIEFRIMKQIDTVVDFITGREVPDIGAEANRQAFERALVELKGFSKEDIEVDVPLNLVVAGKPLLPGGPGGECRQRT